MTTATLLLIALLLPAVVTAKPVQDVDESLPYYKKLADSGDENLRYVEPIGDQKLAIDDDAEVVTTPLPVIPFLSTTPSVDPKLDDEMEDESSSSEENEAIKLINATFITSPLHETNPNYQLSVEEYENQAVFYEKHKVIAKKPISQIIWTVNAAPTFLPPQIVNAPKPLRPEVPTTSLYAEKTPNTPMVDKKQPTDEKQKISASTSDSSKQSPKIDKSLISSQISHHRGVEIMDEHELHETRQQIFDPKQHTSQGGDIIYSQSQQILPMATFIPPPTIPTMSSRIEVTAEPKKQSFLDHVLKGYRCFKGDCKSVFVSTTPPKPRELKQLTIIRRVRHDKSVLEVECKCLNK